MEVQILFFHILIAIRLIILSIHYKKLYLSRHNRGADPRARRMGAGRRPDHSRRAQSGQVPCSGARRQGKGLDNVSAAIPGGAAARNREVSGSWGLELAEVPTVHWTVLLADYSKNKSE